MTPKTGRKKAKRANASVKKRIANAVETIPKIIAGELEHTEAAKMPRVAAVPVSKTRTLLWTGVSLVTALIFGIWVWNVEAMFTDVANKKSAEGALVEEAKGDIQDIFSEFSKARKEAALKHTLEEAIAKEALERRQEMEVKTALQAVLGEKVRNSTASSSENSP